ncbi:hypothetical protein [Psychromonas hadalis]|uniref:hypothetical protein n=1 Tax=Psychromonas hadalis TaxID=211669 RepID=UPI0003B330EF|nr:hypothetical protein [Psychromonas hadalis]
MRKMKQKIVTVVALFSSITCFASEVPSNSLQVEYQKSIAQITTEQIATKSKLLSLNTVYQIPVATYHYLDEAFTSLYNKVTFNTSITDSTFKKSAHYELISIPLIAENTQGLQVELFGNFSDPSTQRLSNFSADQTLSDYYSNTAQFNIYNSELALGAGISFNTGKRSKIKMIISNSNIPGYGNSNALVGFETRF